MINRPQSLQNINTFTVNNLYNFYYIYKLDYESEKYVVFDMPTFESGFNIAVQPTVDDCE